MKNFYIYKITNKINGKIYIGQSVSPEARWRRHKSDAKLKKKSSHLVRAIRKYNIINFKFEVIAQSKTLEDIDELEIFCIKQYNSSNQKYGYNISLGGNGKRIMSEETKKKISIINTGKKATQETKDRMSQSMIGKNAGKQNGMFGKKSVMAKLTLQQAILIREEYKQGDISLLNLSFKFNVSKKTILNIIQNKIYRE